MNVVDLHPEELIDRLTSGTLTVEERARLEAHLSSCDECRFELAVRGDLEEEARTHRERPLVAALGPRTPSAEFVGTVRPGSVRPRTAKKRALLLPILAAALLAGGAFAAVVSEVVRARQERVERLERTTHPRGHDEAAFDGARTHVRNGTGARSGPAPVTVAASATAVEGPPVVDAVATPVIEATLPAPSSGRQGRPTPTTGVVRIARASLAATAANVPPARIASVATRAAASPSARLPDAPLPAGDESAMFGAANRARRDGETARAIQLYRELQGRFPASEEARLSRATLATLLLDHGDARAALDGFDRYLAQGSASLGVEALVGRALALQQLGQRDAELAAWRDVQRRFPGTVHARRASARIAALGER